MNREGYPSPTEEAAVGHETMREGLRKKHRIKEGDIVWMAVTVIKGGDSDGHINKTVKVRIREIHKHFVTVILPNNQLESFRWWDFERRRRR